MNKIITHLGHCYQGEYKLTCKYGDPNCPAKLMKDERDEEDADLFFDSIAKLTKLELRRKIERLYNEVKDLKIDNKKLMFALEVKSE